LNGTDAFTLVFGVELVGVAMTAAEGEGHTATNVVIVVPPGDRDAARSWVHRQCAHTYNATTSNHYQLVFLRDKRNGCRKYVAAASDQYILC